MSGMVPQYVGPAVGGSGIIPHGPVASWSVEDLVQYANAIALGHLDKTIRENGIDGQFLLQCSVDDLAAAGINQLQANKITMTLPK